VGVGFCDFLYKPRVTARSGVGYFPRRGLAIPSTLMKERRSWNGIWRMIRLRILSPQNLINLVLLPSYLSLKWRWLRGLHARATPRLEPYPCRHAAIGPAVLQQVLKAVEVVILIDHRPHPMVVFFSLLLSELSPRKISASDNRWSETMRYRRRIIRNSSSSSSTSLSLSCPSPPPSNCASSSSLTSLESALALVAQALSVCSHATPVASISSAPATLL